ncbi:MAG: glycosyltransferase family 4 protein [Vulcanimicrobiota bacterium]
MRIGFDLRSLQSGTPPWGIGVYTSQLLAHLALNDRDNEYCFISWKDRDFDIPLSFPVEFRHQIIRVPFFDRQLNIFRDRLFLKSELRKYKLDITHFPSPFHLSLDFDMGSRNDRNIITVHDLIPHFFKNEVFTGKRKALIPFYRFLQGSILKAGSIISVSDNTKKDLCRLLSIPESQVTVIYHGVGREFTPSPDERHLQVIREKYRLPACYLLYVGNFFSFKNIERLLDALTVLGKAHGYAIPLVIGGHIHPYFRESLMLGIRKRNLEKRVIMLGYVQAAELPLLYAGAELFVYPSLYEGFGFPPLEAMACGTPVACSRTSSLPEVVGTSALLFDPLSPDDMANAIREILENRELRERLHQEGLRRAEGFTWEKCAGKTLELYQRMSANS